MWSSGANPLASSELTGQMKDRNISGAMFADKMRPAASTRLLRRFGRRSSARGQNARPAPPRRSPTSKQKVNFTFDSATYFLFSVRGLASYQDEGKCQDGGSAEARGVATSDRCP